MEKIMNEDFKSKYLASLSEEERDKYIKAEEYVTKLHTDFPLLYENCFEISVSKGWQDIVYKLSEDLSNLMRIFPDQFVKCAQVKEKFGGLRYYVDISCENEDEFEEYRTRFSDATNELITEATYKANSACDVCGKDGKICGKNWMVTRCDDHKPND
jgi:hypothetical protein